MLHFAVFFFKKFKNFEKKAPLFITQIIEFGGQVRSTGATGVNADSSRSHAILQLEVKVVNTAESLGRYDPVAVHIAVVHTCSCVALESSPLVLPHVPGLHHCSTNGSRVVCCQALVISDGL